MDGTDFRLPVNARVRLRDGIDPAFYEGMAKVGNEGWITAHKRDKFDLPQVYVRWDTNHWSYNRQPDGWTFEDHFDLIEDAMSEAEDNTRKAVEAASAEFAKTMAKLLGSETPAPEKAEHQSIMIPGTQPAHNSKGHYEEAVQAAKEALSDSEAFVTVVIRRSQHPDASQGMLRSILVVDSLSPEAEVLVGAQASAVAAQFHEAAAILQVYALSEEAGPEYPGNPEPDHGK